MARLAVTYRPPYLTLAALFASMLFVQPTRRSEPPKSRCVVEGEWQGDLYVPPGHWSTPTVWDPAFRSNMPIYGLDREKLIDVVQLIDAFRVWTRAPQG